MRTITVTVGFLGLLGAVRMDAQVVGAPIELPITLRENLTPTSFFALGAVEGPGSEIGATVRQLRPGETAVLTFLPLIADGAAPIWGHGVVVKSVAAEGPASRAGLKPGDILLFYAYGVEIDEMKVFARLVHDTPPGRALPVSVVRDGMRIAIVLLPELGRAGTSPEP